MTQTGNLSKVYPIFHLITVGLGIMDMNSSVCFIKDTEEVAVTQEVEQVNY